LLQHLLHGGRIVGIHVLKELCLVPPIDASKVFVVEIISFTMSDAITHSC
jgi:hypothetical protein